MRGLALVCVLLVLACGRGSESGSAEAVAASSTAAGPVVARVNGEPIGLNEVRAVCAASQLSPEEAFQRVIDERLLAQYARARGYGELSASKQELERARVRALLEQVVERGEPSDEARRKALDGLVNKLKAETKVSYDENAVRQAFADDGALGPGS